ncbi:MAG: DUF1232 domain-containing protein [Bacteroidales bacterium]|nr:DUF1232 domain-containing protein [Bacteroidales bacterium]
MEEILQMFGGADNVLPTIKSSANRLGRATTKMMLHLFYVMKSPQTSVVNKSIIIAALAYQLLPKDVLSVKKFGLLGLLDNAVTLTLAYNRVKSSVTPEIEKATEDKLNTWFSETETSHDRE